MSTTASGVGKLLFGAAALGAAVWAWNVQRAKKPAATPAAAAASAGESKAAPVASASAGDVKTAPAEPPVGAGAVSGALKHPVEGVCFDLDGTLIETSEIWYLVLRAASNAWGYGDLTRERWAPTFGQSMQMNVSSFYPNHTLQQLDEFVDQNYDQFIAEHLIVLPGAVELVKAAHARTRGRVCVVTNCPEKLTHRLLKHCGLNAYFPKHAVVCSGQSVSSKAHGGAQITIPPKPSAVGVEYCLSSVLRPRVHGEVDAKDGTVAVVQRLRPKDVVLVGDSKYDVEAGKKAGVQTIGIGIDALVRVAKTADVWGVLEPFLPKPVAASAAADAKQFLFNNKPERMAAPQHAHANPHHFAGAYHLHPGDPPQHRAQVMRRTPSQEDSDSDDEDKKASTAAVAATMIVQQMKSQALAAQQARDAARAEQLQQQQQQQLAMQSLGFGVVSSPVSNGNSNGNSIPTTPAFDVKSVKVPSPPGTAQQQQATPAPTARGNGGEPYYVLTQVNGNGSNSSDQAMSLGDDKALPVQAAPAPTILPLTGAVGSSSSAISTTNPLTPNGREPALSPTMSTAVAKAIAATLASAASEPRPPVPVMAMHGGNPQLMAQQREQLLEKAAAAQAAAAAAAQLPNGGQPPVNTPLTSGDVFQVSSSSSKASANRAKINSVGAHVAPTMIQIDAAEWIRVNMELRSLRSQLTANSNAIRFLTDILREHRMITP